MRFIIPVVFFLSFCTFVMGQRISKADSIEIANKIDDWNKGWKIKDYKLATKWYSETASKGVIIQNSFPKGGPYTDPTGKKFGHSIFWTRVINETATPLELTINFPADSFAILPSPDSYLKLFLPPDTMTLDKEWLYDYGATGLKSFLDTGLNKPTMLQRTINPKEECLFYIGALSYQSGGMVRAGLVLKEQNLFYRISIIPHFDSALFPCGHIIFKK